MATPQFHLHFHFWDFGHARTHTQFIFQAANCGTLTKKSVMLDLAALTTLLPAGPLVKSLYMVLLTTTKKIQ